MAIAFVNDGVSADPDINSTANATSYASASWTPPTSGLIFVFVYNVQTGTPAATPTISGNGLTWTQIATVGDGGANEGRMTLFGADAAGSSAGATTVDFSASTQAGCQASFFHATSADLSGGVPAAFVQSPTNSGTNATSGTVALAAAGHPDNRPIAGFAHRDAEVTAPDAAWTEVDDLNGSAPNRALETQWDADGFQNASASWVSTTTNWCGIAAEIKAEVAGGGDGLMPGMLQAMGIVF